MKIQNVHIVKLAQLPLVGHFIIIALQIAIVCFGKYIFRIGNDSMRIAYGWDQSERNIHIPVFRFSIESCVDFDFIAFRFVFIQDCCFVHEKQTYVAPNQLHYGHIAHAIVYKRHEYDVWANK